MSLSWLLSLYNNLTLSYSYNRLKRYGILVEHDMNDILFFSPDHFGIKSDRTIGESAKALGNQYNRRIESISMPGPALPSAEKHNTSLLIPTSAQSSSPTEKKTESSGM